MRMEGPAPPHPRVWEGAVYVWRGPPHPRVYVWRGPRVCGGVPLIHMCGRGLCVCVWSGPPHPVDEVSPSTMCVWSGPPHPRVCGSQGACLWRGPSSTCVRGGCVCVEGGVPLILLIHHVNGMEGGE